MRKTIILSGIVAILAYLFLIGADRAEAGVDLANVSFEISGEKINGTPDTALEAQTLHVRMNGCALVQPLPKGTDLTYCLRCCNGKLPSGIKVTVTGDRDVGQTGFDVVFTGTPKAAIWDEFYFEMPAFYLVENGDTVTYYGKVPTQKGKFNIVRETSSRSSSTWFATKPLVIDGTAGVNMTQSTVKEVTVLINGVFLSEISAGKDISDWFKGESYYFDPHTYINHTTFLPDGVVAKVKNKVPKGSNSITVQFTGTPTECSSEWIGFTLPGSYAMVAQPAKKCEIMGESVATQLDQSVKFGITDPSGNSISLKRGVMIDYKDVHVAALNHFQDVVVTATLFGLYWFVTGKGAVNRALSKERLINSGFYDLATAYQSVHVNY